LEETHCYPRGGGQPGDTGLFRLEDGATVKLEEVLPGEMILHPVEEIQKFSKGQKVKCEIDVIRRNGHTMMHTAQHIFSALAEDLWGCETVGNQIGADQSRVDLLFEDKELFNPEQLIENVNSVLSSNIPVNIHEWERDKILGHEKMRHTKFMHRIPSSITHLRVVEVEGIDLCPCAGTHVSNTSQIPRVRFLGKKNKGKGRLRVSYDFE
jgi:misacylated tRNA(Ala) deacylase